MQAETLIDIYEEILRGERESFPNGTWTAKGSRNDLKRVIRFLVLEKLEMTREDLLENMNLNFWCIYKIRGAIRRISKQDTRTLVIECFPEWDIKPWQFKKTKVPHYYWNNETVLYATKWLIEERLNWDLEKVQNEISDSYFHKHGLAGMLQTLKIGAIDAVALSYPEHDWTYLKERRGYKITRKQAAKIRQQYQAGINMYELARMYKVSVASIFYIIHKNMFKEALHE